MRIGAAALVLALVVLASPACKRKVVATAPPPPIDAGAPVAPPTASLPTGTDLRALLCGSRAAAECRLDSQTPAGTDASGASRIAATIVIAEPPRDDDDGADDGADVESWLVTKKGDLALYPPADE